MSKERTSKELTLKLRWVAVISLTCLWTCLLRGGRCWAQRGSTAAEATGSVTGHVLASDTQQPARFVDVLLYAKPREITTNDKLKNPVDARRYDSLIRQMRANVEIYQTRTSQDGTYSAEHIPTGDYYVLASALGYLQPKSMFQAAYNKSVDPKVIDQALNLIHVSARSVSNADLTLQRGAAISGRLHYDDGTPLSNTTVMVMRVVDPAVELPAGVDTMLAMGSAPEETLDATSDDQGRFRIAGIPEGRYILRAAVITHTQAAVHDGAMDIKSLAADYPLMVYAPDSLHKADAKAFTLKAPEERVDEDVTVNLNKLYSVSGQVISAADHEGVAGGTIWLTDTNDQSLSRSTELDSRGNFVLTFVPQGTYTIGMDASTRFQEGSQAVVVMDSDITVPAMALAPVKAAPK